MKFFFSTKSRLEQDYILKAGKYSFLKLRTYNMELTLKL